MATLIRKGRGAPDDGNASGTSPATPSFATLAAAEASTAFVAAAAGAFDVAESQGLLLLRLARLRRDARSHLQRT